MDYAFGIMSKDLPDLMLQRFSLFQEFYSLESAVQFLKKKKSYLDFDWACVKSVNESGKILSAI